MLLQELLSYQDKFPRHYTAGLEGCGPSREADIRSSYYALIRRLVGACRSVCQSSASRSVTVHCSQVSTSVFVSFNHGCAYSQVRLG